MSDITFKGKRNPKIVSNIDPDQAIRFYLNSKDLFHEDDFSNFRNACKGITRQSARYTNVKAALFELGLDRCQVFSGITKDMAPLEMHHGPIFDMNAICSIVIDHLLVEEEPELTTFKVADLVLREHELHNIQLFMLCETAHQAAENGSVFLNFNQAYGRLDRFIKKYRKGIRIEHLDLIEDYIEKSKEFKSTDNGVFELYKKVKKYVKK